MLVSKKILYAAYQQFVMFERTFPSFLVNVLETADLLSCSILVDFVVREVDINVMKSVKRGLQLSVLCSRIMQ